MLTTAGCAVLILFHTVLRRYPRDWYWVVCSLTFAIALGTVYSELHQLSHLRSRKRLALPSLALVFLAYGVALWSSGAYPWQREMHQGALWVAANTPASSRIGSFNAGIYAYYSQRAVTNLDGVVNSAAFDSLRTDTLMEYVLDQEVDFLIDYQRWFEDYGPFFGSDLQDYATLVAEINDPQVSFANSKIVVYRVGRSSNGANAV